MDEQKDTEIQDDDIRTFSSNYQSSKNGEDGKECRYDQQTVSLDFTVNSLNLNNYGSAGHIIRIVHPRPIVFGKATLNKGYLSRIGNHHYSTKSVVSLSFRERTAEELEAERQWLNQPIKSNSFYTDQLTWPPDCNAILGFYGYEYDEKEWCLELYVTKKIIDILVDTIQNNRECSFEIRIKFIKNMYMHSEDYTMYLFQREAPPNGFLLRPLTSKRSASDEEEEEEEKSYDSAFGYLECLNLKYANNLVFSDPDAILSPKKPPELLEPSDAEKTLSRLELLTTNIASLHNSVQLIVSVVKRISSVILTLAIVLIISCVAWWLR
ncbi:MAG: hypothetical protein JZU65_14085 [Chlorobium sp.]|nr:hypothetical protein [Chlorobium sp.]